MVRVRDESWSANSKDELRIDEIVKILSVNGLTLLVGKISIETSSSQRKFLMEAPNDSS
jgi:membrane-bound ClpP family serine protease